MADMDTPLLIQTMQELIRTIRENSPVSAGQRGNMESFDGMNRKKTNTQTFKEANKDPVKDAADQERVQKALKENTKALKDTKFSQESYNKDAKLTAAAFKQGVEKLSLSAYDELPKRISALTEKYQLSFKTKDDIDRAANAYQEENIKRTEELSKVIFDTNSTFEDLKKASEELEELWGKKWKQQASKTFDQLEEEGTEFFKALKKDTIATNEHAAEVNRATGFLKILGFAAERAAELGLEAAQASSHLGVALSGLGSSAILMGMSQEGLAKIQNENLRGIRASGESIDSFNTRLKESSRQLILYTGSMEGGVQIEQEAIKASRMLTSNTLAQNKYVDESKKIFMAMNATTGETWEQFNALSESLLHNQSVQTMMYRVGENQRVQADLELKQTAAYLNTMGLLDDETKNVVATFAELGAQGPKERRKLAAQVGAVGGALGITGAQQISQMIARGETQGPEFAQLIAGAQQQLQGQYAANKNGAGEFGQYALTNLNPQLASLFGQGGGAGLLGTRTGSQSKNPVTPENIGKAVADAEAERQSKLEKAILEGNDISKALLGKGILQIAKDALELVIGLKWIKNFLGKGGAAGAEAGEAGIAGGLARGLSTTGAKGILKTFGAKIPLVGALISGGLAAYDTGDVKQGLGNAAGTFGGAAAGGVAGAAIGSVVPIIGTAIGGLIGAGIGGYFGGEKGQELVKHFEKAEPTKAEQEMDENDKEQLKILKSMDDKLSDLTKDTAVQKQTDEMKKQHQETKQMTQEQIDAYNKTHQVKQVHTSKQLGSAY